ncbi:hypothetical protein FK531_11675 [Rhodococcus spelaei]|uniref:Uncharacterized protein n=1 Tax=Rhodococcus spelaei TaxID=2546320 RepID=A0A541BAT1_9NOCA|nr:hypothetical protein [Rhodococcus spelaei]TQF69383.1 hypothetical protein FK531_11675 [Rhodococcus spelaei]
MPVDIRTTVASLAALLGAALAAFVLTTPPGGHWSVYASDRQLDSWLAAQPTGVAVGAVVAVVACVLLQRSGSRRLGWSAATLAVVVLIGARVAVPASTSFDALTALHYLKTAAAGVLLGSVVATSWGGRAGQWATALGAIAGFLSVQVSGMATLTFTTSSIGEPSWWLLWPAAVLALASAVTADAGMRIQRVGGRDAGGALLTIVALAVVNRLQLSWINQQDNHSRLHLGVVIGVAMVVVLVAIEVCARLVERESGGGGFLLATTGVAAAAMPVLVDLRYPFRDVGPWPAIAVAAVAVAVGLRLSARWRTPVVGLGVAGLVPLVAAIWPDFGHDGPWLLVRLGVIGVGAGLAVGSTLPGLAAVAAAGLAIPFVSMVFSAAATAVTSTFTYSGSYEPLRGATALVPDSVGRDDFGWTAYSDFFDYPHYDHRSAGIALAVAVAFCAFGIRGLLRSQPTQPPEGGQQDEPGH